MVPKLPDLPLDFHEFHSPIYDAPRGVADTKSTPQLTARALRALRRDIFRANSGCSLPLTTVPQSTLQARQELPALMPHSDRLTVSSNDLSNFQPSIQHSVAPSNSYINCASPKTQRLHTNVQLRHDRNHTPKCLLVTVGLFRTLTCHRNLNCPPSLL